MDRGGRTCAVEGFFASVFRNLTVPSNLLPDLVGRRVGFLPHHRELKSTELLFISMFGRWECGLTSSRTLVL